MAVKSDITILAREMSESELQIMNNGFDLFAKQHGDQAAIKERYTYVALHNDKFIGCSSGLVQKFEGKYSSWFYLTDMYVDEAYRKQGIGRKLLVELESQLISLGVKKFYTWTKSYEGPSFYKKLGYEVFVDLEDFFYNNGGHIGLLKRL